MPPPSSATAPRLSNSSLMPEPVMTASTPQRLDRLGQALAALGDLLGHVRDVEVRDLADLGEQRGHPLRLVGVQMDLQRVAVADDEHRVAEPLERVVPARRIEVLAGDREVRAVAERGRLVLRVGDAGGRVVRELRGGGAAQRGDHAREHHGQAVAAGVDHARPRAAPAAAPARGRPTARRSAAPPRAPRRSSRSACRRRRGCAAAARPCGRSPTPRGRPSRGRP